jgi:hypothetical protein
VPTLLLQGYGRFCVVPGCSSSEAESHAAQQAAAGRILGSTPSKALTR